MAVSHKLKELGLGDEVGGTIVVFASSYLEKRDQRVHFFVGITRNGKYQIFRSSPSQALEKFKKKQSKLQKAIMQIIEKMKTEIKLKHDVQKYYRITRVDY
jgi:hypothetical protein